MKKLRIIFIATIFCTSCNVHIFNGYIYYGDVPFKGDKEKLLSRLCGCRNDTLLRYQPTGPQDVFVSREIVDYKNGIELYAQNEGGHWKGVFFKPFSDTTETDPVILLIERPAPDSIKVLFKDNTQEKYFFDKKKRQWELQITHI